MKTPHHKHPHHTHPELEPELESQVVLEPTVEPEPELEILVPPAKPQLDPRTGFPAIVRQTGNLEGYASNGLEVCPMCHNCFEPHQMLAIEPWRPKGAMSSVMPLFRLCRPCFDGGAKAGYQRAGARPPVDPEEPGITRVIVEGPPNPVGSDKDPLSIGERLTNSLSKKPPKEAPES